MTALEMFTARYDEARSRLGYPQPRAVVRIRREAPAPLPLKPTRPRMHDYLHIGSSVDIPADYSPPALAWKRILFEVADEFGVSVEDIQGPRRSKPLVAARDRATWRMSSEAQMTQYQIARRLGNRDRSTIRHSLEKTKARMIAEAQKASAA